MGSKAVEVSDETCHVNGVNHYSVNVGDTPSSFKNKACDSLQHTTSETSNLLSVNSSYDSLSENAESRAPLRFSNTSDDLEGADKLPNKYYDSKGFEVHEDNVSCLSRANDTNIALSNHNRNVERKNFSCSLASVGSVDPEEFGKPQKLVLSEMPPLKDAGAGSSASKEKLPECSGHMDSSSLTKEAASRQKVASHKGLEVSTKICSKFEVETSDDGHDPKEESLKYSGHDEQEVKSSELVEAAGMQPSQSVSGDDESDIVEHDVKVCDICGDAGREDMLATCSRCSDGAEHVYCMRKMLRRVPKGDWLCEECKFAEETDNQKQDIDGKRMKKAILSSQLSNKRRAEITEVVPSSKRQTLETRVGSPKSSSPKRTVALSRESSFKSMDKDKLKSAYQTSHSPNDMSETARTPTTGPRLQTAKGAFLKSNSFNTLNSKPKVKLVDNIVPQKQKGSKEQTSLDMKERAARMMGKSVSFKSANSGRSNVSESKVKMLSSKLTPLQDLKGLKQAKERSTIERKNLSKLERPLVSLTTSSAMVSTPKVDQASRGETSLLSSVNNLREHKAVLSDGKLSTSSKAISLTYKGVESQSSPGRASPMSGMCSSASEQKSNQVVFHDEPLSSFSWVVEKLPADVDGKLEDMPRSWEMTNQADKTRETSVRCRPTVAASPKGLSCPICKEIGHTAESCKIRISQASITDVSPPRSYREEVPRGSRLKDAIHAALLRKPEIYRKKTVLDQSDELFTSNMELSSEVASQDQLFISNVLNNNMCTKGSHDGQAIIGSSTSDSCKNTVVNNIKPHTVQLAYSVISSSVADSGSVVPSLGKPAMKDLQNHASVGMSLLVKTTAIPEYEYIWQGSFELQRDGNILDLCGGIQAHLSTSASPKVLEVVNKFPHKIPLKEVPRFSVWPTQFHQSGVKEDNIALYFFAKDLESYERNYKVLLDAMIKNDLALKGKFGGVELLILPSNQLPEKSQRWNMLFFLWGVFRETRVHYLDSTKKMDVPGLSDVSLDNDTPTVMTLSKNLHIPEHIGESSAADRSSGVASASKSPEPVFPIVSKEFERKDTYPEELRWISKENLVLQDSRVDSKYTTNCAGLSGGVACTTPSLVLQQENRLSGKETIADRKNKVGVLGGDDEEVILEKVNIDRELKRDDGSKETEAACVTDLKTRINSSQTNNRTHPHRDLLETAASSTANQEMPWNLVNSMQRIGESDSKKPKIDSSGLHGFCTSQSVSSSSVEEKICLEACNEKVIPEDLGATERHFFPVESRNVQDFLMDNNSLPWKNLSSGNDDKSDGFPSLELALRAETKPPSKGNLPFFVGLGDEKDYQDRPLDKTIGEKEDDVSASLSLSLSFPFPDKEQPVKPVTIPEQLLPERHHVNTSLLLFGRFPEK